MVVADTDTDAADTAVVVDMVDTVMPAADAATLAVDAAILVADAATAVVDVADTAAVHAVAADSVAAMPAEPAADTAVVVDTGNH